MIWSLFEVTDRGGEVRRRCGRGGAGFWLGASTEQGLVRGNENPPAPSLLSDGNPRTPWQGRDGRKDKAPPDSNHLIPLFIIFLFSVVADRCMMMDLQRTTTQRPTADYDRTRR